MIFGKKIDKYCNNEKLLFTNHYNSLEIDENKEKYITTTFHSNDEIVVDKVQSVDIEEEFLLKYVNRMIIHQLKITKLKVWKLINTKENYFFYKIHKDSITDFEKIINKLKESAIKSAKDFKQFNEVIYKKSAKLKWEHYYKIKDLFDTPIAYNYSSTTHRAQGSQYDVVFVDIEDIKKNRNITERNKLMYVATSRACKKLIIYE